jgi:hypothetical protein
LRQLRQIEPATVNTQAFTNTTPETPPRRISYARLTPNARNWERETRLHELCGTGR